VITLYNIILYYILVYFRSHSLKRLFVWKQVWDLMIWVKMRLVVLVKKVLTRERERGRGREREMEIERENWRWRERGRERERVRGPCCRCLFPRRLFSLSPINLIFFACSLSWNTSSLSPPPPIQPPPYFPLLFLQNYFVG